MSSFDRSVKERILESFFNSSSSNLNVRHTMTCSLFSACFWTMGKELEYLTYICILLFVAKPIRPGQQSQIGVTKVNNSSASLGSADSQGSVVIRSHSPSKIPIVPGGGSERPAPVIRGGQRDGDPVIGGSGVSQRIKSAIGPEALPRSSRGHRSR